MERRLIVTQKIEYFLALIVTRVKLSNKLNFTDINIIAEDFFKALLNLLYNYNLQNANAVRQNESAIDIFFKTERIAYQITSQNRVSKLKKTVQSFIKGKKYERFSTFKILTISDNNKCNSNCLEELSQLGVSHEYLNISDLLRSILFDNETEKLEKIADFLEYEIHPTIKDDQKKEQLGSYVNEDFKSLHIVDQILETLKIFNGFTSIHPRTIAKLYPFNIGQYTYDTYSHYCLKTDNKAIHELLQNVKIKDFDVVINDDVLKPFEEKLRKIFSILNHSLIRCICYREQYTEIEHHKINITPFDSECDCLYCQFSTFKINSLFSLLKGKAISHSENLEDALGEGYYLCKLGEHIKGWQVLNSVMDNSVKIKNPVIQFLSQYNIKQIRGFVNSFWWESENKLIIPKIDAIDLHNTLCSLQIPIELRDELLKVKEANFLHHSREIIEEQFESILKTNKLYKKGGYSSGTQAIYLLQEELHIIHTFYSVNHIVADDFSAFRNVITKGIEGIFISLSTDKSYEYRFKKFDNLIISLIIFYVEEGKLEKLLKNYNIENIEIRKSEKGVFIETMINFFSFQYSIGLWGNIKFNEDISKQDTFSHYRQSLRYVFSRIMMILSKVELTDAEIKPLTEPIVKFLRASKNLSYTNWSHVINFFAAKIHFFSQEQIRTIIEVIFDERQHHSGDDIFESICELAFDKVKFILTDKDFFECLIHQLTVFCKKCKSVHSIRQLLSCWDIADETCKAMIKQKAIEYLEKKFDPDFYLCAAFKKIFTKDESPRLLQKFIASTEESCSPFDLVQEKSRWTVQNYTGHNYINCLAYMKVDFSQENIQAIAKISEYYNWLINCETYEYSNFDVKWLDHCPFYIKPRLLHIDSLKEKVKIELKRKYEPKLAEFFIENLN